MPLGVVGVRCDRALRRGRTLLSLEARWRPSPRGSWAARSRSPMRRRCASGCLRTATPRSSGDGDVAVVNTCCVTHEAVSKSRQAVSRAARTHGRVLRHGLRRQPRRARSRTRPRTSRSSRAERGDAGRRRRRRGRDRLRAGGRAARADARVREDPGRLLVLVRLLRHPARARRHAQPARRRRARGDPHAASRRDIRRSSSPASTSAASAIARPATRSRGSFARRARSRASSGSGCRPSRSTT